MDPALGKEEVILVIGSELNVPEEKIEGDMSPERQTRKENSSLEVIETNELVNAFIRLVSYLNP